MATQKRRDAPSSELSLVREHQPKRDWLLEMIRGLAVKQQLDTPQVFLSLRVAADRFGVSTSAMATIYRQLKQEGVLSSVRGSHTMLREHGTGRNLRARGLIGMPVSISRFQTLQDHRQCFLQLRDELHKRDFVTTTIFFEQPDGQPDIIIARLKKEKVEAVIWLLPEGADRETVLRLRDLGMRFIGVNITSLSGLVCRYQVARQQAIRTILRNWRADPKINMVTIVRISGETGAGEQRLEKLQALVASEKIKCEISTMRDGQISTLLKSLCQDKVTGIILPAAAAAMLGWRAPETLKDVLGTCRIALIDGPMDLPFAEHIPQAEVDLVTVNWHAVTRQIADDVLSGEAFDGSKTTVFEAEPHLRAPFKDTRIRSAIACRLSECGRKRGC
jgi:hypothetical protein